MPFRQNGGRRAGAGRKPAGWKNGEKAGVSHGPRALLAARFPAHVTLKLQRGLPRLRSRREYGVLRAAFAAGNDRFGFRLTHYAVLNDHLHLLVEARDRRALSRGLQGLLIRIAKALNKLWQRATNLAWKLDRQGLVMQATDLLIATHALHVDAAVLTFDSDYKKVPSLEVLNAVG